MKISKLDPGIQPIIMEIEDSLEAMAKGEKAKAFIMESLPVPQKCKECRFMPLCRAGGCKRNRESADYCESYKKFFSACLPLFRVFGR